MTDSITKYLKAIDCPNIYDVDAAFGECKSLTGILPDSAFLSEPPSSPIWFFRSTTVIEFKALSARGFRVYNITKRISDIDIARDPGGDGLLKVTAHVNFSEPLSITLKATGANVKYLNELVYSLLIPNLM